MNVKKVGNKIWSLHFHDKKFQNPTYCFSVYTTQDYNQAISHVILRQIFDTAKIAYCILSDHYTDNLSCCCFFMVVRAGIDQEETESSDY